MPPQLLETVEDEKEALRDIVRERLRLDEKQRLRDIVAAQTETKVPLKPFTSRFDVPPEFTPEQRAEKAAATMQRLIGERAQTVPFQDVADLALLEPKLTAPLKFSETRKLVAERQLFPDEPGALGHFFRGGERRAEALLAGVLGFGLEKLGADKATTDALINRARVLTEENRRVLEDAGLSTQIADVGIDLAEFAIDIALTRGAGRLVPKKKIAKKVIEAAVRRGVSKRTATKLAGLTTRSPEEAARFAAAAALNAGLNTFAVTGNLTDTTLNALVGAAVGGTLGAILGGIPALGQIAKSARAAPEPRFALGLPETGSLTRRQIHDAALARMKQQRTDGATPSDIIQTAKTAQALSEAVEAPGRPRIPGVPRPTRPPKPPQERPDAQRQGLQEQPRQQPPLKEAGEEQLQFFPPEKARPPQEEVAVPRARPPAGTPRDPQTAPNASGFRVSDRSLVAEARKSPARRIAETAFRWHSRAREPVGGPEPARPRDPNRLPIWAKVKGLRPVRKARVFLRRQQFVRLKEPQAIFDADVPASKALLSKLASKIEKAKPLRGRAEALKAKERRRRAGIMDFIQRRDRGERGALRATAQLRGEYPSVGFEPIGRSFSRSERDAIFDHINTHRSLERLSFAKARLTLVTRAILDVGHLPTRGELAELELIFGPRFARALFKKADAWKKLRSNIEELVTLPRTIIAAYDLSATGRQGFSMILSNPVISARGFASQLRALASERNALALDKTLRKGPAARLREEAGLELPPISGEFTLLSGREEIFASRLIQKFARLKLKGPGQILAPLKWHGMGVRASERAYITYLNTVRSGTFDSWANLLREAGFNPRNAADLVHFRNLAKFINAATGRGNINLLKGPFFNAVFFAPRFMQSRFEHIFVQLPKNALGPTAPLALRQLAMRQLVGKAMTWFGMAKLIEFSADAFGLDIDMVTDPRSADFLKLRVGKTRIDMGVGYGQVIRVVARLATDETVDPLTQKVSGVDPISEVGFFLRYKLSPVPSAILSVEKGETPSRDPATFLNVVEQLTLPISAQSLREIVNEHGARGLVLMMPEILGVGVSVQDREIDQAKIQNFTFSVTRTKADPVTSRNIVRGLLSRGVSPSQLRAALLAEAIEQAINRARRRKKPVATAASVRDAVSRALKSPGFRTRQRRLEEIITEAQ